ncbi:NAD-dependent epimerase/dehydratase family protein [Phosphitispora sp. TUW77]|uniref:NAD-dependent epimerase/dehydratase family protein n=1 Tax=Phosphitispora sp. TUW77 TaxID=3152361 RepID=UPI003AB8AFC5
MVTGGAGFIGSHTVDKLIDDGAEVVVVDDLSTGTKENLHPRAQLITMDIASEGISEVFQRYRPEYVIHLAAQVSVPKSLENPVKDCVTNAAGSVNILENCRLYGVKKLVYASSAAVYGNPQGIMVSETDPREPMSFYGISKLVPEYYLRVFGTLYGLKSTVLRYANVFGPRQGASGEGGVVSIFAAKLLSEEKPCIHGDGEQTRDFIYVGDVARANVSALFRGDGLTLNVGTGTRVSVNQLYKTMSEIAGIVSAPDYTAEREGDIKHMCMGIKQTTLALEWQPRFSLEEGLQKTLVFCGLDTIGRG